MREKDSKKNEVKRKKYKSMRWGIIKQKNRTEKNEIEENDSFTDCN